MKLMVLGILERKGQVFTGPQFDVGDQEDDRFNDNLTPNLLWNEFSPLVSETSNVTPKVSLIHPIFYLASFEKSKWF